MSEHHFGVGRGRVSTELGKQINAIAMEHGATFTWAVLPGDGPKYWFSSPDGAPFTERTERKVIEAIKAAGLTLPGWSES